MINDIDLEYIKKVKWYRQGGAGLPFYFCVPFDAARKHWGKESVVVQQDGSLHHGFFDSQREWAHTQSLIERQVGDRGYIDDIINDWSKALAAVQDYYNQVDWLGLSKYSSAELLEAYKRLTELDSASWNTGILIEAFDPWAEKIINDWLKKYDLSLSAYDLAALTTPVEPSIAQCEELDLLAVAAIADSRQRSEALEKHQRTYFWINRDWANVTTLGVDYFQGRIGGYSEQEATDKRRRMLDDWQKEAAEREAKLSSLALPAELVNVFHFFRRMGYWRDVRKRAVMINNGYYYQFAQEFARRAGVSYQEVTFLTPQEVLTTGLDFSDDFREQMAARVEHAAYYHNNKGQPVVLIREDFTAFIKILSAAFNNQFRELRGQPASRGRASGPVRIINVPSDFSKMKPGDILVAPMTRPEYLPLMQLAAAIITDEGGVTCHAAIVSRELRTPCVIGTQVATEILQDGEMVEVDADNGMIKKL